MDGTSPVRERMHYEEKGSKNNKCTGSCTQGINKILLVSVACLAVALVIVIAIVIWQGYREDRSINRTTLNKFYPGFFRTEAEQLKFANKAIIYVPVTKNFTSPLNCGFQCNKPPTSGLNITRKRRSAADFTFNGCCKSNTFFISPDFKDNLIGVNREFVKIDGAQQFFQTGSCEFAIGCTGCTCMMSQEIETAVVYKPGVTGDSADDLDDTEIDTFYFEKCCKCFNIGT